MSANVDNISEAVKFEDLHPTYQQIAAIVGVDLALKLGAVFNGTSLYFPAAGRKSQHFRLIRNRLIIEEYNGTNIEALAKKYRLTAVWIRYLVASGKGNEGQGAR